MNKGSLQAQAPSVPTEIVERLSAAEGRARALREHADILAWTYAPDRKTRNVQADILAALAEDVAAILRALSSLPANTPSEQTPSTSETEERG